MSYKPSDHCSIHVGTKLNWVTGECTDCTKEATMNTETGLRNYNYPGIREPMNGWYPVRCCCTPLKIFGFLRLPRILQVGKTPLKDRHGVEHALRIETMTESRICMTEDFLKAAPRKTIEQYARQGAREFAVYSEDRPIEFWREFNEFVEVQARSHD